VSTSVGSPSAERGQVERASLRESLVAPLRTLERREAPYYLLLGASVLLLSLGLVMVLSASSVRSYVDFDSSFAIARQQAQWLLIGAPLMWVAAHLPVRFWRMAAYPAVVGSLALLALLPFVGREINGNTNWFFVGGVSVQPSEAAKLALALWGADLLARKRKVLGQWKHLLVPLVPVAGALVALVLYGGDLGTALILCAILGGLLFVAGAPLRLFAVMGVLGTAMVLVLSQLPGTSYRMDRITGWLDPASADPMAEGYQALHGKYALGSGGWFGVGLGASWEKVPGELPEAHTDFIFAIIGEELGLVGTIAVLLLFAAVGYGGFRVALHSRDPFVRLAAAGVTSWILVQAMVNIGAVIGVLPITGIPLPLVSYGGSALLPTMVALGMLLSFARRDGRRPRRAGRPRPAGAPDRPAGRSPARSTESGLARAAGGAPARPVGRRPAPPARHTPGVGNGAARAGGPTRPAGGRRS
jgi:cell division protein FtsW